MKLTLSWLKDHLETSASLAEIVDTLTRIGLEVEGVEDPSAKVKGFVVARVIEAKQHPNADRLRVCIVDAGGEPVQVVCGAPNARTGMKGVFSPVGTFIPGKKITLAKGVIRGVESNGMLCSAAELELSNDHDGIIELPDDAPVGAPYATYAGLDDPVIDIDLTPNRPDATGVSGIARDLAAAGLGTLKTPAPQPVAGTLRLPDRGDARFLSRRRRISAPPSRCAWCAASRTALRPNGCRGACARSASGRSARWSTSPITSPSTAAGRCTCSTPRRSRASCTCGARAPAKACWRSTARPTRSTTSMVVIADEKGVESIAGVMGGEHSGCDETTRDVLIESALWDPPISPRPGASSASSPTRAIASSAASIPTSASPAPNSRRELVIDFCGGEPSRLIVAGDPAQPQARDRISL